MTSSDTGSGPIRARVCAVLLHDGLVCLIRRQRPAGVQLSFSGGVVEDGEDPTEALRRELLDPPVLRFVQDQCTPHSGAKVGGDARNPDFGRSAASASTAAVGPRKPAAATLVKMR
ncbi:NUDIX domain-containing protein [Kitasatospora sp. NPDC092286]|uniref:NUDIX domain-containing protein n=1 Tax=Kitasatospora sp. NPDC092286 TaxID=3364087 RepID=UPI003823551C